MDSPDNLKIITKSNSHTKSKRPTRKIAISKREVEVLEHLSKGLIYKAIPKNLYLSLGTVRKHIENIYKMLQVNSKI